MWSRAVGRSPRIIIKFGDAQVEALVDTGSQVTTITSSLLHRLQLTCQPDILQMRLTAADGLAMPLVGCVVSDVTVDTQKVEDVVVMVTSDPPYVKGQPELILGMNVLQRLTHLPSVLFPTHPAPATEMDRGNADTCDHNVYIDQDFQ